MKIEQIFSKFKDSNPTINQINSFCESNKIILSEEYIKFLLNYDGSILLSERIVIKRVFDDGFKQSFYLKKFLSFDEVQEHYKSLFYNFPEQEVIEFSVTSIGATSSRTYVCIGISNENLGHIYLWDGDFGVTKQAENLKEFFDSLTLDESDAF